MAKPMDAKKLAQVTEELLRARRAESRRLAEINAYVKDRVLDIYIPPKANAEYKQVAEQSRFNITQLLIDSVADNLFVDGYRPARSADNAAVWQKWQDNRMDARQSGLWRTSLQYGAAYATVLPADLNGQKSAKMTPWSPRRLTALYVDPINDEWPEYFMTVGHPYVDFSGTLPRQVTPVAVYDATHRYEMPVDSAMVAVPRYIGRDSYDAAGLAEISINATGARSLEHGMGFAPAVKFPESMGDLDEGPMGVVEPMLPAQRRLTQTSFGLGMAELYAAFKQRWVTGLEIQEDEEGNPKEPFDIAVDRLLQAEDVDTKFGEFTETNLDGYLNSRDKTLLYISSVRKMLPHTLVVGNAVSNISAEALAALAAGHGRDVDAHQTCYGESTEQMLRAAGKAAGDKAAWEDTSAQVRWRDTTPRSLAQVADALGKLAVQLGIPARGLWERIPGVTDEDLSLWDKLARENDSFAKLEGLMNGGQSRGAGTTAAAPAGRGGDRPVGAAAGL